MSPMTEKHSVTMKLCLAAAGLACLLTGSALAAPIVPQGIQVELKASSATGSEYERLARMHKAEIREAFSEIEQLSTMAPTFTAGTSEGSLPDEIDRLLCHEQLPAGTVEANRYYVVRQAIGKVPDGLYDRYLARFPRGVFCISGQSIRMPFSFSRDTVYTGKHERSVSAEDVADLIAADFDRYMAKTREIGQRMLSSDDRAVGSFFVLVGPSEDSPGHYAVRLCWWLRAESATGGRLEHDGL